MARMGFEVELDALGTPQVFEQPEAHRVLVTGASGILGQGVARALIAAGSEVVTLQRRPSGVEGAEDVRGSVADPEAVARAMDGVDTVVHVAAKVSVSGREEEFELVNVAGTQYVVEAALAAGDDAVDGAHDPGPAVDELEECLRRPEAPHPAQHRPGGVLEGDVEVGHDARDLGHGVEQVGADLGRLQVAHPHPLDALDGDEH